jgi:hypothetical protein
MLNEWCMSAFGPRDTDMQVSARVALPKYQHKQPIATTKGNFIILLFFEK